MSKNAVPYVKLKKDQNGRKINRVMERTVVSANLTALVVRNEYIWMYYHA